MKHEDRPDKELSHLISIVKTLTNSKELDGVNRLSEHKEQIQVFKCVERFQQPFLHLKLLTA